LGRTAGWDEETPIGLQNFGLEKNTEAVRQSSRGENKGKKHMKLSSHGNGNGLNDLYIGFENEREKSVVCDYLRKRKIFFKFFNPNEKSDFAGYRCIEIPFRQDIASELENIQF